VWCSIYWRLPVVLLLQQELLQLQLLLLRHLLQLQQLALHPQQILLVLLIILPTDLPAW
jgi:hypothetical protein